MSDIEKEVGLRFGALAPLIRDQLEDQGVRLVGDALEDVGHYQKDADAVMRLAVRDVLTETEARRARWRLTKRVLDLPHQLVEMEDDRDG